MKPQTIKLFIIAQTILNILLVIHAIFGSIVDHKMMDILDTQSELNGQFYKFIMMLTPSWEGTNPEEATQSI